jgi:MYXO-CTERM domain-containing protein
MKTTLVKLTATCALAFAMASGVQAQILANDPFLTGGSGYTVGSVNGQGPAVTGFTGNWYQDFNPGSVSATPISYSGTTGYQTTPGSGALVNNQDARNGRALDPSVVNAFTAASGTVYISFLMQFSSVAGYQAVELGNNTDGGRFLQLGYSVFPDFQNSTDFGITLNASGGGGVSGVFGAADTSAHLFVLQLNLTSGTDTLNAWEDPASVTGGVVTGGTEVSLSGFTAVNTPSNFLLASFLGGSAGTEVSDVRIGNTLTDVTAVPEPSVTFLALPGLGALFLVRRRMIA